MTLGLFKSTMLFLAVAMIVLGAAFCMARIVRGPSAFDRVLALDCLTLDLVGAILLESMLFDTDVFVDVALVVLLVGFIGTMSLAMYLDRYGD